MNTKKLKKLMTVAFCVIFAVCFAFPASAVSFSTVKHYPGGVKIQYSGSADNAWCSISTIQEYEGEIHIIIPDEEFGCELSLEVFDGNGNRRYYYASILDDHASAGGETGFDPNFYCFTCYTCGYNYQKKNYIG